MNNFQFIIPADFEAVKLQTLHKMKMIQSLSSTPEQPLTGCTRNILGPQIRKLRYALGWSQAKLAARLQLNGLDISREVLAQMESQFHCIKDNHIFHFACVLKVRESDFFVGLKNEKLLRNHNNSPSVKW